MSETELLVTAIGTAIVGPVLAYLKVREDRLKTGDKRDTQYALIEKRMQDCEKKLSGIDEVKTSIQTIMVTLSKIETIIEMHIKWEQEGRGH